MREEGLNGDSYSKPAINLLTNPSNETAAGTGTLFTNALQNPKADGVTVGTTYIRTNLSTNPSSETTAAFSAAGTGTVTSVGVTTSRAYVGTQSTQLVLPGGSNSEGWKASAFTVSPSTTYTVSFYVYLVTGTFPAGYVTASDYSTNLVVLNGTPVVGTWVRMSATCTTTSTQTTLMPWGISTAAGTYCLDALLLEQTDQLRPYFDGTGSGPIPANNWTYAWTGTAQASTSTAKCLAVTVRTNLSVDPAATAYKNGTSTLGWENTRWSAYSTYSLVTGATDGPIPQLTTYARVTCSTATANTLGWQLNQNVENASISTTGAYPVSWAVGTYLTISAWGRSSTGTAFTMRVRFYDSSGNALAAAVTGTSVGSGSINIWNRGFVSTTVPTSTAYMAVNFSQLGTVSNQVNDTLDATGLLAEINVASVGDYFDGTYLNASDFTYVWSGAANASTPLCYGAQPIYWTLNQQTAYAQMYQHTNSDSSHTVRVRFPANMPSGGYRVLQGTITSPTSFVATNPTTFMMKESSSWGSYTATIISILEGNGTNGIGASGAATTTATVTTNIVSVTNTTTPSTNAVFYHSLTTSTLSTTLDHYYDFYQGGVFATYYGGNSTYFDGSTVSTSPDFTYAWTGTANLSSSTMRATGVNGTFNNYTGSVQSTEWAASGTKSLRVVAVGPSYDSYSGISILNNVEQGKTYTFLGTARQTAALTGSAYGVSQDRNIFVALQGGGGGYRGLKQSTVTTNAAGVYQHRVSFAVPLVNGDPVTILQVRLYNGHPPGNGDVWWDNLMLVEGVYNGPYVDGDMPGITWAGTAHSSTSKGYPLSPLLVNNTWPNAIPAAASGWQSEFGTGGAITTTYATGGGPNNRNYMRATWTTAPTGGTVVGGAIATAWNPSSFPPGQTVVISIWVRASAAFVGGAYCYFYPSGVATPVGGTNITLVPGVWTRVSATVTIPLGVSTAPYIQFRSGSAWSLAAVGTTLDSTMAQITVGSTVYDYSDSGWAYPPQIPKGATVDTSATSIGPIATNLGITLASPATTWYTAYQLNTNGTAAAVYPMVVYGDVLDDTNANTYSTLRYGQTDATTGVWANRKTGGGGAYYPAGTSLAYAPGVHVLVHGINANNFQTLSVDGNLERIDSSSPMANASTMYKVQTTSIGTHLRTLGYPGEHTAAQKSQIITYLRNKYGA